MKNFRKVLALILVVATLFSFVAMASAKKATEYTDYADVKYVEAVDVLTAIGITEGYNGAFHANDPIGRDEVAAMVARLRNAGDLDADLYVGADKVFADVKGEWSEGYVTYCAQLGIVAGRNATTFDPTGKVTGVETLKMLLCVLGYDAAEQGYVGANWQVNVVRDAKKMGLLDGLDSDIYAAATRDEVAQMFLNALKSKMVVGYIGEGLVKITNSVWHNLKDYPNDELIEVAPTDAILGGVEFAYCNAVITNDELWEIFGNLELKNSEDCYDRPGHTWTVTVNGKAILDKHYSDAPLYTQTAGDWDAVLDGVKAVDASDLTDGVYNKAVYRNGDKLDTKATDVGNGVLVEVYEDRIIVVDTYIAKVTAVRKFDNEFDVTFNTATNNTATLTLGDYEVAKDDVVLVWICDGTLEDAKNAKDEYKAYVHDVKVIEPVAVEVVSGYNYKEADWNDSYLKDTKATRNYAWNMGLYYGVPAINRLDGRLTWHDVDVNGKNWDLYLDEYGYIMYLKPTDDTPDYFYTYLVEGTFWAKNPSFNLSDKLVDTPDADMSVDMVNFAEDGALSVSKDVETNTTAYNALAASKQYGDKFEHLATGRLVKAFVNDDGETEVAADENKNLIMADYAAVGTELGKGKWKLYDNETGEELMATNATVFMIRTMNRDGSYTYEQVTGVDNLKGSYIAEAVWTYSRESGKAEMKTNIQYFEVDHNESETAQDFVSYVFIDAKYTKDVATTFMPLDEADFGAWETYLEYIVDDDFFAYTALVGGEKAVVLVDADAWMGHPDGIATDIVKGKLYKGTVSYIGATVEIDGVDLPIYHVVEATGTEFTYKDCYYEIDEIGSDRFVKLTTKATDGKEAVTSHYRMAKDAPIWVLTINADGDAVAHNGYLPAYAGKRDYEAVYAIVNADDATVLDALYLIDNAYWPETTNQ